ncbi:hypothetical protein NMY22_g19156 [Coprinellus aureogranulatus]|nr:hypothetical protein NMY22_g19156 [Coprinellus aureogranulatus]
MYKYTALAAAPSTSSDATNSSAGTSQEMTSLVSDNTDSSSSSSSDEWFSDEENKDDRSQMRIRVATSTSGAGIANQFAQDIAQELLQLQEGKDKDATIVRPLKSSTGLSRNTTIKPLANQNLRSRKSREPLQKLFVGDAQRTPLKRHNLAIARAEHLAKAQPSLAYASGMNTSSTMPHLSAMASRSPASSASSSTANLLGPSSLNQGFSSSVYGKGSSPYDVTPTRRVRSGTVSGALTTPTRQMEMSSSTSTSGSGVNAARSGQGIWSRMWGGLSRGQASNDPQSRPLMQ